MATDWGEGKPGVPPMSRGGLCSLSRCPSTSPTMVIAALTLPVPLLFFVLFLNSCLITPLPLLTLMPSLDRVSQ